MLIDTNNVKYLYIVKHLIEFKKNILKSIKVYKNKTITKNECPHFNLSIIFNLFNIN